MRPEEWAEIERLFNEALGLDASERDTFLERETEDDGVRRRVRSMLGKTEDEGHALDRPMPARELIDSLTPEEAEAPRQYLGEGDVIGPYRVDRLIAVGGMGAVYLATRTDGELEQQVAIKLLRTTAGPSPRARRMVQRFRLERQVLSSLRHPCITHLLDVGTTDDGWPYIVMEYVRGVSIADHCASLGLRERASLFIRVCEGVQHAHQTLVVHRDIKPQNILVTPDGTPKVLDFGIARLVDQEGVGDGVMLTHTGEFLGTLAYASPEQLRGDGAFDTRSDVYSLGVVLYQLLTGRLPHEETQTLASLIKSIEHERPERPSVKHEGVPADLDAVVLRAIAKERERRYQSAGELADDLRRFLGGEPVVARSDSRWYVIKSELKRRRVPLVVAGLIVVVSVTFGIFARMQAIDLADRTERLERALLVDSFQRGRLLGRAGNLTGAENLLWAQLATEGESGVSLAIWGLRELYASVPLDATLTLGEGPRRIGAGPGGRLIAFEPGGGLLEVLDARTGAVEDRVEMPGVVGIACSRSGEHAAWVDAGGAVWSCQDAAFATRTRLMGSGGALALACSDDGGACILLSEGGAQQLVIAREGAEPVFLAGLGGVPVRKACFAGASEVFALCDDATVRRWDVRDGRETGRWTPGCDAQRSPLAVSSDGHRAIVAKGRRLLLLDLRDGSVDAIDGANGWIQGVAFVTDRAGVERAATVSADYAVRLWDLDPFRIVYETTAHTSRPTSLTPLSEPGVFVSVDERATARIWRLGMREELIRDTGLGEGTVLSLAADPTGESIGAALDGEPDRFQVVSARAGDRRTSGPFNAPVCAAARLPDGAGWICATYSNELVRFEPDTLTPSWRVELDARPNAVAVSPDGERFAVACDGGSVRVHAVSDASELGRAAIEATRVPSVAWSALDDVVAIALPQSDVVRVDPATFETEMIYDGPRANWLRVARFDPTGDCLAFSGDDTRVRIWRRGADGRFAPERELTGHLEGIFSLAFSPDGSVLASAGRRGTVLVWDLATGTEVASFDEHENMVFAVQFADDASLLVSGGIGASLITRDLDAIDERVMRNRAGRGPD